MAFFKFRKKGDGQPAAPAQPESIEAMRRRAKYRLIGATVLVLIGVIAFPLMFDKQPRPIAVDLSIEIPDRNKVKPLTIPVTTAMQVDKPENAASAPTSAPTPAVKPIIEEEVILAPATKTPDAVKPVTKTEPKTEPKPVEKPAEKPAPPTPKANEAAKAQALLEGREPEQKTDASEGRYVVQVGAFADATRAREVRLKVEQAGLKTYTQVAETKDGRRIRVRVGPFAVKTDADKAAEKIKKLDLPAAILTL